MTGTGRVWEAVFAADGRHLLAWQETPEGLGLFALPWGKGGARRLWPEAAWPMRKHWGGGNLAWVGDLLLVGQGGRLAWGSASALEPWAERPCPGPWAFDAASQALLWAEPTRHGAVLWRQSFPDGTPEAVNAWADLRVWDVRWQAAFPERLIVITYPTANRPWHASHVWTGPAQGADPDAWRLAWAPRGAGACPQAWWAADGALRLLADGADGRLALQEIARPGEEARLWGPSSEGQSWGERSREAGRSFVAPLADGSLLTVATTRERQRLVRLTAAGECVPIGDDAGLSHWPWLAASPDGRSYAALAAAADQETALWMGGEGIVGEPSSGAGPADQDAALSAGAAGAPGETARRLRIVTVPADPEVASRTGEKPADAVWSPVRLLGPARRSPSPFAGPPRVVPLPSGAFARYYPPRALPPAGAPPAVFLVHNGPEKDVPAGWQDKAHAYAAWGLATVYVNFAGALAHERALLAGLTGAWGERDAADVREAREALAGEGLVDPARCVLMGGGVATVTVFQALARHPGLFRAGVAVFPWADPAAAWEAGGEDEASYLRDTLLSPAWRDPGALARHWQASLATELLLVEGGRAPCAGVEPLAAALAARGVPCHRCLLPGEGTSLQSRAQKQAYQARLRAFFAATVGSSPDRA